MRRKLESSHGQQDPNILEAAWPHLDSVDPWIRHAARIAIEHQPIGSWQQRALTESRSNAASTALMALARNGKTSLVPTLVKRLCKISLEELDVHQKLVLLYTYSLCISSQPHLKSALVSKVTDRLDPLYPDRSIMAKDADQVNRALSQLLIQLEVPSAVPKTLALLRQTTDQKQQLHFLYVLSTATNGWTLGHREAYFEALQQSRYFQGGEGMPGFVKRIHDDAVTTLSEAEREQLKPLLAEIESDVSDGQTLAVTRPIVRDWKMVDIEPALNEVGKHRDFKQGQNMFRAALCIQCHRMGTEGRPIGPDLTSISSRFSRRDIVASIISPSKVVAEQYRTDMILTTEGKVLTGRIVMQSDFRSPELLIATNPLQPWKLTKVPKALVESHTRTQLSSMPEGLLNTLTRDEILDLLAYVETAGRTSQQNFRP